MRKKIEEKYGFSSNMLIKILSGCWYSFKFEGRRLLEGVHLFPLL